MFGNMKRELADQDDYGCGFYGDDAWNEANLAARRLLRRDGVALK